MSRPDLDMLSHFYYICRIMGLTRKKPTPKPRQGRGIGFPRQPWVLPSSKRLGRPAYPWETSVRPRLGAPLFAGPGGCAYSRQPLGSNPGTKALSMIWHINYRVSRLSTQSEIAPVLDQQRDRVNKPPSPSQASPSDLCRRRGL